MTGSELTVVIPAYNAAAQLAEAVRTAREVDAAEVIVVDDGSTDETASIARNLGCKVITQDNSGAALARQKGVEAVTTRMVILLDADDAVVPQGIDESVRIAEASENWAFVAGATLSKGAGHSSIISPWPEGISVNSLLARGQSAGPPGAFLWRTSVLKDTFRDDPPALRPRYAEDYELLIRGSMLGEVLCHGQITCIYASEGGKSALSPLRSNAAAEDIRRFYANTLKLPIRERSHNELQSLAFLRLAYASRRGSLAQLVLYARAAARSPLLLPALIIRRGRRLGRMLGSRGASASGR